MKRLSDDALQQLHQEASRIGYGFQETVDEILSLYASIGNKEDDVAYVPDDRLAPFPVVDPVVIMQTDLISIREKIQPLVGQRPWDVSLGHGSFLTMDFGGKRPERWSSLPARGDWHLWVQHVAWRLEQAEAVLAACEDPRPELAIAVKVLQGRTLQAMEVRTPALETTMTFEDGIVLRLFPVYTTAYEHWWLFTPNGNVLAIGPGIDWSYHLSSRPWRPAPRGNGDDRNR